MKKSSNPSYVIKHDGNEFVETDGYFEYRWNVSIKTSTKIWHSKLDISIWNRRDSICAVAEVSCPVDLNIIRVLGDKEDTCSVEENARRRMFTNYTFNFIPIIFSALGTIPKYLTQNIKTLDFDETKTKKIIYRIRQKSTLGTVKKCKTFLNF